MSADVDLKQLALPRERSPAPRRRPPAALFSRYLVPLTLVAGFVSLFVWAGRDYLDPPKQVTVVPVLATQAVVQPAGTSLFKAAGWVEPRPTPIRVAALEPGVVARLLVVEDQPLAEGKPIAELVAADARLEHERALADSQLRAAELEQARAVLAAAQLRLDQPVHLEAELAAAEASRAKIDTALRNLPFELRRAEARLKLAQDDFERKSAVTGVVSGLSVDQAKSELASSRALVEELTHREEVLSLERAALERRRAALAKHLELLIDETRTRDEAAAGVKVAQARVQQARVAAAQTQLALDRMTVRAPVAGRVYRLIAHPGARLGSGASHLGEFDASTVVTMYQPQQLQVRVDVRFVDLPRVQLKQPVQIDNPALDSHLRGEVLFISSQADIQKNTLEVKVAILDPPVVFKPEMLVEVTFLAPETTTPVEPSEELRLYVPRELVQSGAEGEFVWLADQSAGIARQKPVVRGNAGAAGMVEIRAGLAIGSRLIAGNPEGLADGMRIRVTGESQSGAVDADSQLERLPAGGHH